MNRLKSKYISKNNCHYLRLTIQSQAHLGSTVQHAAGRTHGQAEARCIWSQASTKGDPAPTTNGDRSHETDVVIIGSGIGGLCCAALLARYGYRVTVCEAHYHPGGAAHGFDVAGYQFDAGPSFFAGLSAGPPGSTDSSSSSSSSSNPLKQVLDALGLSVDCATYDKVSPSGASRHLVCVLALFPNWQLKPIDVLFFCLVLSFHFFLYKSNQINSWEQLMATIDRSLCLVELLLLIN